MTPFRSKSRLAPALIVAGVIVLPVLYVVGYLHLGVRVDDPYSDPFSATTVTRIFSAEWQARAYIPASFIEARITGVGVALGSSVPGAASFYAETCKIDP